jgi:hypothetical protein
LTTPDEPEIVLTPADIQTAMDVTNDEDFYRDVERRREQRESE